MRNADLSRNMIVVGNQSADLDSVVCSIVLARALGGVPVAQCARVDLAMRTDSIAALARIGHTVASIGLHCMDDQGVTDDMRKQGLVLVDHNVLTWGDPQAVVGVVDHHVDEQVLYERCEERIVKECGSCSSLVARQCAQWLVEKGPMRMECAQLLLDAIVVDTAHLQCRTTDVDRASFRFLLMLVPGYDAEAALAALMEAKTDVRGLTPEQLLRRDFKELVVPVASIPVPIARLGDFDLRAYAEARGGTFLICAAWLDDNGQFQREFGGVFRDKALQQKLEACKELALERMETGQSFAVYKIDGTMSRKKIAPLLSTFCAE